MTVTRINPQLPARTRSTARQLREHCTNAERALWFRLRAGRLSGYKFRRQHPIPPYIVDFYCHELKLVVELDGSQHTYAKDKTRTKVVQHQGADRLTILG